MRHLTFLVLLTLSVGPSSLRAQTETDLDRIGSASLSKTSGGSVHISHGIHVVSRNSSLELQWLMVRDSSLGIIFREPVGAKGVYDEPWYRYSSNMKMLAVKDVRAFEVRLLTFNIWGQ